MQSELKAIEEKEKKLREDAQNDSKKWIAANVDPKTRNIHFFPTTPQPDDETSILSSSNGVPKLKKGQTYLTDVYVGPMPSMGRRFLMGLRRKPADERERLKIRVDDNGKIMPLHNINFTKKVASLNKTSIDELNNKNLEAWRDINRAFMYASSMLTGSREFEFDIAHDADPRFINLLEVSEFLKLAIDNKMVIKDNDKVMEALRLAIQDKEKNPAKAKLAESILQQMDAMKKAYNEDKGAKFHAREAAFNTQTGMLALNHKEIDVVSKAMDDAIAKKNVAKIKEIEPQLKGAIEKTDKTIKEIEKELKELSEFEKKLDKNIDTKLLADVQKLRAAYETELKKAKDIRENLNLSLGEGSELVKLAKEKKELEPTVANLQKASNELSKNYLDVYSQSQKDPDRATTLETQFKDQLQKTSKDIEKLDKDAKALTDQIAKVATLEDNKKQIDSDFKAADAAFRKAQVTNDARLPDLFTEREAQQKNAAKAVDELNRAKEELKKVEANFNKQLSTVDKEVAEFNSIKNRVETHLSGIDHTAEHMSGNVLKKYQLVTNNTEDPTLGGIDSDNTGPWLNDFSVGSVVDKFKTQATDTDTVKEMKTAYLDKANSLEDNISQLKTDLQKLNDGVDKKIEEYNQAHPVDTSYRGQPSV